MHTDGSPAPSAPSGGLRSDYGRIAALVAGDLIAFVAFATLGRDTHHEATGFDAIGQTLDLVIPAEERADHWRNYRRVMATGVLNYRPDHVLDVEGLRRDGTRVMLDVALISIRDEAGRLVGITAIMRQADRDFLVKASP